MTTRPLVNVTPELTYARTATGRTVRGMDLYSMAMLANITALARPLHGFHLRTLTPGTYQASYRRSHDAVKQAAITWTVRCVMPDGVTLNAGEVLAVTMTITDAAGHTVAASDPPVPASFRGETTNVYPDSGPPSIPTLFGTGYLDLDAIAAVLTDPSWSFQFVVARAVGTVAVVEAIDMREIGRTIVNTADTYGVDPADFQPGQPIGAGSSTTGGALRLAQTIEGGIATLPDMLHLGWIDDIAAAVPQTTSAAYAAMTNLLQSAGVPMRWRVPVRPLYYALASGGTTLGERARWRVRYYVAGGGTADVQLLTGATGSPYSITGLTGAAWAWSAWQTIELPTSGTDAIAELSLKGRTSAGTLCLAGIHVQSF